MARMTERQRWAWLSVILILGVGMLAGGAVLYAGLIKRDHCELERARLAEYEINPPATETGRGIERATRHFVERNC
jgi:hypothetical protein